MSTSFITSSPRPPGRLPPLRPTQANSTSSPAAPSPTAAPVPLPTKLVKAKKNKATKTRHAAVTVANATAAANDVTTVHKEISVALSPPPSAVIDASTPHQSPWLPRLDIGAATSAASGAVTPAGTPHIHACSPKSDPLSDEVAEDSPSAILFSPRFVVVRRNSSSSIFAPSSPSSPRKRRLSTASNHSSDPPHALSDSDETLDHEETATGPLLTGSVAGLRIHVHLQHHEHHHHHHQHHHTSPSQPSLADIANDEDMHHSTTNEPGHQLQTNGWHSPFAYRSVPEANSLDSDAEAGSDNENDMDGDHDTIQKENGLEETENSDKEEEEEEENGVTAEGDDQMYEDNMDVHETTQSGDDQEIVQSIEFDPFVFIKNLPPLPKNHLITSRLLPSKDAGSPPITLVLDLDETLVHCSTSQLPNPDLVFPVDLNGQEFQVYMLKRPFLFEFLNRVSELFEVVVFTASQAVYADKLLDLLDCDRQYIKHRLFRDSCVFVEGNYLKDLSILGRDMARSLIIDNSPQAFGYNISNGIPIESWYEDREDRELLNVLEFLETIANAEDVRPHVLDRYRLHDRVACAPSLS